MTTTVGSIDGPLVVRVERFGYHSAPTTLVVVFNAALDPASASNPLNYVSEARGPNGRFGGRAGLRIQINNVTYDDATTSVTIHPAHRLNLHRSYRLTLIGTGSGAIKGATGALLDGNRDGVPGGNSVSIVNRSNLVLGTPSQPASNAVSLFGSRHPQGVLAWNGARIVPPAATHHPGARKR